MLTHFCRFKLFLIVLAILLQAEPGRCEIIFADDFESGVLSQRWDNINFSDSAR